jgi:hypothetical protein
MRNLSIHDCTSPLSEPFVQTTLSSKASAKAPRVKNVYSNLTSYRETENTAHKPARVDSACSVRYLDTEKPLSINQESFVMTSAKSSPYRASSKLHNRASRKDYIDTLEADEDVPAFGQPALISKV